MESRADFIGMSESSPAGNLPFTPLLLLSAALTAGLRAQATTSLSPQEPTARRSITSIGDATAFRSDARSSFVAPAADDDSIAGTWGIDFTSAYYFRGIIQENQGVIAQPYFEVGYGLYEGEGSFKSLSLVLGQWNSLHDGATGSGGTGQSMWYESDFYAGLSAAVDRWSLGATYTAYYSPNGRFGTVEELGLSVGFDDSGLISDSFALKPSAVIAFELEGQADAGTQRGIYAQLGIEPSFALGQVGELDVTLALPVTFGFSLGDYYEVAGDDDALGFFDFGAVLSSPLPFLPARLGPWQASVGLHILSLGDSTETYNSGEATEIIGSFGLSTSF
jgi:hypothetical protein